MKKYEHNLELFEIEEKERIEKMDRRTEEIETVGYIKPEVIEKENK